MIFLLFLISIAIIGRIVTRPKPLSTSAPSPARRSKAAASAAEM